MFKELKSRVTKTQLKHKESQSAIKKTNEERQKKIKEYRLQNKQQLEK